jgi:hypothetical protein
MNIKELLNSDDFFKKSQIERLHLVENFKLTEKNCKIGNYVLCFENEAFANDYSKLFIKYYNFKPKKIKSIKIGSKYLILDYKDRKIKIINDLGKKHWYSIDRFLYSLKIERKEKLKNLMSKK